MKRSLVILLVFINLVSCKNKTNPNEVSINTSTHPDKELEQLILQKGDSSAYYELSMQYLDYGYEKFLPFALIMANKYDYPQAYFDVFSCLWEIYGKTTTRFMLLDSLDYTTQKMAIDYLKKASFKGHGQAKEILGEYYLYGMYIEKDTILGNQLIKESDNL